ncbi:MAG TPA: carbohydrate ABC transporter permease, partial [Candidatus Limnocylindrales bacterium]|nr:carbohydrate ABC transporter permease [Candidatus Limnocylindrales bacterium]
LWNSFLVTLGATLLAVLVSLLAGFAYSRHAGRGLQASAFFLIFVRLFPPIVITLPLFPVVNWLKLNDTHLILILLYATFFVSLGTIVMRTFIDQIPRELDEAAMIDGAGSFRILRSVIIPQAKAAIVAVSLFHFFWAWNEFFLPLVYLQSVPELQPLAVGLAHFNSLYSQEPTLIQAAAIMAMLLPVVVFFLAQRAFMRGVVFSGVEK